MTDDFIHVTCPECQTILVVNRRDGKIVEVRKPILDQSETTGDRFEDAMLKVRRSGDEIERKVEQARQREREKMDRLNALFNEGMEQAKQEGPIEKPKREFDLD